MALVAWAYQHFFFFTVIESASKVGTPTGNCPGCCLCSEENKVRCNNKLTRGELLCYFNPFWFSGDIKSYETEYRFNKCHPSQKKEDPPRQQGSAGPSHGFRFGDGHKANFLLSISSTRGGTMSLTSPPWRAASLMIEELMKIHLRPGIRKTVSTSRTSFLFINASWNS